LVVAEVKALGYDEQQTTQVVGVCSRASASGPTMIGAKTLQKMLSS
jgi:hypothetical protein